jgi:exonuclease III
LFDFDKQKLQNFKGNTAIVKCANENYPISPYQRIRGYGGCAILWKKELNNEVMAVMEGGNRISVVIISRRSNMDKPICLISVYMPSKGSKNYNQEYINTLDEIHEILAKYRNSHHTMLCGDMNASVHSSKADERDKLFMEFCEQQEIYLVDKYP